MNPPALLLFLGGWFGTSYRRMARDVLKQDIVSARACRRYDRQARALTLTHESTYPVSCVKEVIDGGSRRDQDQG